MGKHWAASRSKVCYITKSLNSIRNEEIPVTLTTTSYGSIYLSPFNYFDYDPSRDVLNAAKVQPNEDGNANFVDLNGVVDACAAELTSEFNGFDLF
jgi:hypothetical protein